MRSFFKPFLSRKPQKARSAHTESLALQEGADRLSTPSIDIPPDDPLISYFLESPGVVDIDKIDIESPALDAMKKAGVKIAVPLVNQGELVGLLSLGSRLSEQEYSADDFHLLNSLATQASPALRVAQLVRQQQAEVQERERMEHELRVARTIQQTLLPKDIPALTGWRLAAYWQPARAVGGDFYDFIDLPDGRLGLVIGDVTDKGVPAALVMATTRSVIRAAAERFLSPGQVLERANNLLCADIPRNMFVTCQYMILDPASGYMTYANAGHNLPYLRSGGTVNELRATGMPLGLLPDMKYDENETHLTPGDRVLFYSDGLVEAHNPQREMFSFGRLRDLVLAHSEQESLIDFLRNDLAIFTGPTWDQEDDVTLMTLERIMEPGLEPHSVDLGNQDPTKMDWQNSETLLDFDLASERGNERQAMEQVSAAVERLAISPATLERLKTAVAEATMNAIEHGNKFRPELMVNIRVEASSHSINVFITDNGGGKVIPEAPYPDLDAKLAGLQSPRGWGLFLIKNMVDEMHVTSDDTHHTVELVLNRKGDQDDR